MIEKSFFAFLFFRVITSNTAAIASTSAAITIDTTLNVGELLPIERVIGVFTIDALTGKDIFSPLSSVPMSSENTAGESP